MKKTLAILILAASTAAFASEDRATPEMCKRALTQTNDSLDTARGTVKKNLAGGYITQANYDEAMKMLSLVEGKLEMQQCLGSSGRDLEVYRCLSRYGDFMGCLKG
jgi:hypothetical protein